MESGMSLFKIFWVISYTIVVTGLSLYGLHRYHLIYLFWKHRHDLPKPKARFEKLPLITVQLPVFNELHVVERLVKKVAELDYPKELIQIQMLDDSTDETVEISQQQVAWLQERGFDAEFIHRVDRTGYKAGALENGMKTAKGDYIFILDADFLPHKDVLHKLVHFFTDEKVALVQSRWGHVNKEYNLLTKIQAMFLDGHLVVEQTARSRAGKYLNFNGTAGLWRKQAIVDAGGWEHDTLTEDLDLSYRAQMKGWQFIFLLDVETPAELPVDMDGFKSQQHRWAKGAVQTCKKLYHRIWRADIPLHLKIESSAHLTANFAYLLLIFLCFLVFPDLSEAQHKGPQDAWSVLRVFLLDIPIFIMTTGSVCMFYLVAQWGLDPQGWWKKIIYLPALLALGVGMAINNGRAVLEAILNKESPFVRTPKYGIEGKSTPKKKSKYKAAKSIATVLEVVLAVYFTCLTVYYVCTQMWMNVGFMTLFMFGFWYVSLGSMPRRESDTNTGNSISTVA
jgi:cellulose synthase/poly-beta-1,6-N-acetylglucosamine synthase-like glycosyltransferase